jgi:hypothetical protein
MLTVIPNGRHPVLTSSRTGVIQYWRHPERSRSSGGERDLPLTGRLPRNECYRDAWTQFTRTRLELAKSAS